MWLIIFVFCAALRVIIEDFYIISLIGLASSLLGAACFKIAGRKKETEA
jgi:hypothetical protein